MKGIVIDPGKAPEICKLPNDSQGLERWLGGPMRVDRFPTQPVGLAGLCDQGARAAARVLGALRDPHLARQRLLWAAAAARLARQRPDRHPQGSDRGPCKAVVRHGGKNEMRKIYDAFAAGKPTAKDDLIRVLADAVYGKQPDAEKIAAARTLLESAFEGARDRARSFDVEVD